METFKSRITELETLQQAFQLEMTTSLRTRPKDFLFKFISLLLTLTTILLFFVSTLCSSPLPLLNSRLRMFTVFVLIGLGMLAWRKQHIISITDWQAWVPFKWRPDFKDTKPPLDGHWEARSAATPWICSFLPSFQMLRACSKPHLESYFIALTFLIL